jgi:hypothetical protein
MMGEYDWFWFWFVITQFFAFLVGRGLAKAANERDERKHEEFLRQQMREIDDGR